MRLNVVEIKGKSTAFDRIDRVLKNEQEGLNE